MYKVEYETAKRTTLVRLQKAIELELDCNDEVVAKFGDGEYVSVSGGTEHQPCAELIKLGENSKLKSHFMHRAFAKHGRFESLTLETLKISETPPSDIHEMFRVQFSNLEDCDVLQAACAVFEETRAGKPITIALNTAVVSRKPQYYSLMVPEFDVMGRTADYRVFVCASKTKCAVLTTRCKRYFN